MKKYLLIIAATAILSSCTTHDNNINKIQSDHNKQLIAEKKIEYKTITITNIVKDLKEVTEQHTDYHYKYDILNDKFRQQPNVYTTTEYYVIYTNNTHEEVDRNTWLNLSKGDTIKKYQKIPIL